ncbi:alpha/beta fold hydrolase [Marinitenerispora sediminis]|uniref:Alpha/beta hydrolase n=1 Tax=Marinitenerispora sediminis TaxID=1931232 RepID=A0A368T215_9ACTN|nr:alpha/beta hydrolase [Marinitenerispora sediminis]RCV47665.1 alpha/beta hydrolase [Marinitenerispora sediminis]RCV48088.1 alpha/beta hydrolase [Marinitenerispora sediminis]RCV49536.1 alpha/beta hydrolase [Marinitenerispora sediminis]
MAPSSPSSTSTSIYRTSAGREAVRAWCRTALASWPELHARDPFNTALGTTQVFSAPGGPGTGVVLLPGTNFNAATGIAAARVLAADRPVHLVDLPGQPGLSSAERPRGDRTAAYGAWLREALPQITEAPVILLGHSLGAAVALAAAPGPLVAGLALVNPAGLAPAALGPALIGATLPWLLAPSSASSTRLLRYMSGPGQAGAARRAHPDAHWMTLVATHTRTSLAPRPLPVRALGRWRGTPVRVATGSHDCFFPPARLRGPARAGLDADVHVLPGSGHLALHEAPQRIAALLATMR